MSTFQGIRASASGALPTFLSKPLGIYEDPSTMANSTGNPSIAGGSLSKAASLVDYLQLPSLKGSSVSVTAFTILSIVATMLVLEQILYRSKKAHLPGPKWTIPVIGKFFDSLNPTLENYMKGWNSGPLSVASVFHM